ncbi:MAG TPA: hypothetical protein VGH89_00220, partial [Pseudonocardia sp.]
MPRSGSETSHPHNSFNRTHRGWPVVLGAIVVLFAAVGCDEAPGAGPAGTAGSADQPAGQGAPGAPAGGQPDAPSGPAPGQAGTVSALFELLGSGVGDSVLVDDGQRVRSFHDVPLPFRKEIPISTDADLLQ